jgi:type II secretion system protein I
MRLHRSPGDSRSALTLLEVLIALAIFLLSMGALSYLITLCSEQVMEIKQRSQAARLCQSKMNEVMAGAVALQSQNDSAFDEDPDWRWSLECTQSSASTNLWTVKITVRNQKDTRTGLEESLTQMVLDPSVRGSTLDLAASSSSSSTGTSSGSSTTPSSSTPSSSTPNSSGSGRSP